MWTKEIPKIELHCHLDGSIPLESIYEICKNQNIDLPQNESDVKEMVQAKEDCKSLEEYLKAFNLPLKSLTTKEAFYNASYSLAKSAAKENVRYIEIRFAPLLSVSENLPVEDIMEGVLKGLEKAKLETGIYSSVILCGMRHFPLELNLKNLEYAKKYMEKGVSGIDLAGDEDKFPNEMFDIYFKVARENKIPFTIHAGECGDSKQIEAAISFGAKRIGHGIAMSKCKELKQSCKNKNIGIEMCPSSNLQTKAVKSIEEYPFREFLEEGLKISINTDNRTVTNTTISKELDLLRNEFELTYEEGKVLMLNALEMSFANEDIKRKLKNEILSWEAS